LLLQLLILDARGQFTYWSQKFFARVPNRGLRLDYFICSPDLFPTHRDVIKVSTESTEIQEKPTENGDSTEEVVNVKAERTIVSLDSIPVPGVYDSYIVSEDTVGSSDHCPIALHLIV
jgi:exonuclease III